MKQHITVNQWNELNRKAKDKYHKYITDKYPLSRSGVAVLGVGTGYILSIGEMIEFLDIQIIYLENEAGWWGIKTTESLKDIDPVPELCDALWEAVKEVLEK